MGDDAARPTRRTRGDSIRNRERLVEAATRVFSAGGRQAKLDAVAREAGVGIGTLYRHFPTREALFEAVYRREVDHLVTLAERLARDVPPVAALREWLHANVGLMATKKGMVEALQLVAYGSSELKAYSFERLNHCLAMLLDRGIRSGELRDDVTAEELLRTVIGVFYAEGPPDWQASAVRIVDLLIDGMRRR